MGEIKKIQKDSPIFNHLLKKQIISVYKGIYGYHALITDSEVDFIAYILKKYHYKSKKEDTEKVVLTDFKGTLDEKIKIINEHLCSRLYEGAKHFKPEIIYDETIKSCSPLISFKIKIYNDLHGEKYLIDDRFPNINDKSRLYDYLSVLAEIVQVDLIIDEDRRKIYQNRCLDYISNIEKKIKKKGINKIKVKDLKYLISLAEEAGWGEDINNYLEKFSSANKRNNHLKNS